MKERLRNVGIFFALQFVAYFNVTLDMRAVQHEQYAVAAVTNMVAPLIAWLMVERIGKAKDRWGMIGSVIGGISSTWAGMWLTRFW